MRLKAATLTCILFWSAVAVAKVADAQSVSALEQAKRAFDATKYAEAARLFETARGRDPSCEIPLYLGLAQYRLHQVDAALIAFQESAQCNPRLTMAHLALGDAYAERGNDAEALAAYERALNLEPDNASALRGAASLYTKSKSDAKAAGVLQRLVKLPSADAQAHADLGAAYFATGDQEGAEREFAEALRLDPKSASALLGQSNLLIRKGEEDRAMEVLQRVVQLAPDSFEPRFVLGSAYNRAGQFAAAAVQLETAVRLGGTESEVYYQLARAYGGLGRVEDRKAALARFTAVSSQAKGEAEARRHVQNLLAEAKVLVESGDLPAAFARMKQVCTLTPHDDSALFRMASLGYDLAHYDDARSAIQEAIAIAPSEWIYHFLLGLIEGRSGKLAQARTSLALAVRLNPTAADAHNALGEVALRQGDLRFAEASFRKASDLDPKQAAYRSNLDSARKALAQ